MTTELKSLHQLSKEALEKHLGTRVRNQALVSAHRSAIWYFSFVMLSTIITMLYPRTSILLTPASFYCLIKGTLLARTKTDSIGCSVDTTENNIHFRSARADVTVEQLSYLIPTSTATSALHEEDATNTSQTQNDNLHERHPSSTLRARRGFSM